MSECIKYSSLCPHVCCISSTCHRMTKKSISNWVKNVINPKRINQWNIHTVLFDRNVILNIFYCSNNIYHILIIYLENCKTF